MKTNLLLLALALTALAGLTACVPVAESVEGTSRAVVTGHPGGAYAPRNATQYGLENSAKFVLLSKSMERAVTCSGLQERVREDGRLEVVANLRSRSSKRRVVQLNCVFKDAQGFPVEETPFETLALTENAQEGVRFVSMNNLAKTYTIRVRSAR